MESLEMAELIPAPVEEVFAAWTDAKRHSRMTGGKATGETAPGASFTAWDGYIRGTTVSVEPGRLVQSWRTSEFPASAPDSTLEVRFEAADGHTRVTLIHTSLPRGGAAKYREGWEQFYFTPMRRYFQPKRPRAATKRASKEA